MQSGLSELTVEPRAYILETLQEYLQTQLVNYDHNIYFKAQSMRAHNWDIWGEMILLGKRHLRCSLEGEAKEPAGAKAGR